VLNADSRHIESKGNEKGIQILNGHRDSKLKGVGKRLCTCRSNFLVGKIGNFSL